MTAIGQRQTYPFVALILTVALLFPGSVRAEPRFAARMGASCSMCHINPTGGGMRNAYGRNVFETQQLTSELFEALGDTLRFDSAVNEAFSFGGDFRMAYIGQPTRNDNEETRAVAAGLFLKTPTKHTFFPMQADLYLAAELGEHVTFYSDIGAQGSVEIFGLLHDLPLGLYGKTGIFNVPYGTKLPNHTAAVRQPIGFDPRSKDAGIEIGVIQPWMDFQVAFHNGDQSGSPLDLDPGKAFSGRAAYILNSDSLKLHVGASFLRIEKKTDITNEDGSTTAATSIEMRGGPFLWASLGRFTYVGEIALRQLEDGANPNAKGNPTKSGQLVSYQELNLLAAKGLDIAATYEFMDRDTRRRVRIEGDVVHRFGASIVWFPLPYVEANVIYRRYVARSDTEEDGQSEILAFFHLFF